jgi:hypothetical protein
MFFDANQARFLCSVPGLSTVFQVLRFRGALYKKGRSQ